jgi:predicted Zn-dependent protease
LEAAQRLDPGLSLGNLGIAYYFLGRYADAAAILARELAKEPAPLSQAGDLVFLAAAYAQLDDRQGVERARASLAKVAPFFDPELFISQYRSDADRARLRDGLAKAGIGG